MRGFRKHGVVVTKNYSCTNPASQNNVAASVRLDFIVNYDITYRLDLVGKEESAE
jgi:hypothetical protein